MPDPDQVDDASQTWQLAQADTNTTPAGTGAAPSNAAAPEGAEPVDPAALIEAQPTGVGPVAAVGGFFGGGVGTTAAVATGAAAVGVAASGSGGGDSNAAATPTSTAITSNGGSATAAISVTENASLVTTVSGQADAGETLSYSIVGGADAARFQINASTGELRFVNSPDHETPADEGANNVYDVIVQVSDGSSSASQAIAVTVLNANDVAPVIGSNGGGATATIHVLENTSSVTAVTASDGDGALTPVVYSIAGGADAAAFTIDASTGVLSLVTAPNFEAPVDSGANNQYDLVVQASDGVNVDTQTLAVVVDNVTSTTITTKTSAYSVAENSLAVTTVGAATDSGQAVSYSISGGADKAKFTINPQTGALSFVQAPDFEKPGDTGANNVYDVTITATDGTTTSTPLSVAITVTGVNDNKPVITSGTGATFAENTAASTTVYTAKATDADLPGQTLSYSLSGVDAARFSIDAATGVVKFIASPDFEAPVDTGANNVYDIVVTANDGAGQSATQNVAVTVTGVNDNKPVFTSGTSATFAENTATSAAIYTAKATDADVPAQTLNYSLSGVDAAKFSIDAASGVLKFIASPDAEAPTDAGANNVYDVVITATDGSNTTSQNVAITVTGVNDNKPVFTSGATASVAENTLASATVYTATATDADLPGQTLSYSLSGVDAAKFSIDAATGAVKFIASPDFEAPTDVGANNVYDIVVTANDGAGQSATQNVAITVTDVGALSLPATSSFTVAENATAVGTVSGNSEAPVRYSIAGGADAAKFNIDAATGALRFITGPDFDLPGDIGADNVYNVNVQATDGAKTLTQAITVNVTGLNDSKPVFTSSTSATFAENTATSAVVYTAKATDADVPAQTLSYSLSGVDAAKFSIDAASGVLKFIASPDAEAPTDAGANNVYDVVITATDGSNTTSQNVAITVTGVNDNKPVFTSGATASVAENTLASATVYTATATDADLPGQTLSYSLSGVDAAKFSIDATTGVVKFIASPDFEAPTDTGANNVYDIVVTASDGAGQSATQNVAITVTGVNDNKPVFTSSTSATFAENSATSTAVYTAKATDADLPGQTLSYSLSGTDAAKFSIDATTGVVKFIASPDFEAPTDAGANNVYDIVVTASDGAGQSATQNVAITVTGVNDNSPVFTSGAAVNVAENTATSTAVYTARATDADLPGQALSYSITGGADAAKFSIDATTGVVKFAASPDFEAPTDAGANNVYDIVVTASDGAGQSATQNVAITATGVNDNKPVITSGTTASVAENTLASATVYTAKATDADLPGQTLSYSLSGVDAARFSIDAATGVVKFIASPDFEAPVDTGANNVYDIVVTANDGAGQSATQNVAVTVTGVNDNKPVFTSGTSATFAENTATSAAIYTAKATDADVPAQTLSYSLSGVDAAKFSLDAASGVLKFIASPDAEAPTDAGANNVYDVVITATDGSNTTSQNVAITVTGVNDNKPVFTSGTTASVAENTLASATVYTATATDADLPGQALSYSLSGVDAAKFSIDAATGAVKFIASPDFEVPTDVGANNVYDIVVTANDGAGQSATQNVAITVTDVGALSLPATSSFTVAENATAVGTVSGNSEAPVRYSIAGGADAAKFNIDAATGALRFITGPDFDLPGDIGADNVYNVNVQATDGAKTLTQAVTVNVTGLNDSKPVFTSSTSATFAENSATSTAVYTAKATDADLPGQTLSYSLSGTDAAKFSIDAASGVLKFIASPDAEAPTDAGANNVYDVVITATDGSNTTSQNVAITVTGVNDNKPVFTSGATASVAENTLASATVYTATATDADLPGQTLSYSLSGVDAAKFSIDATTGVVKFIASPDFEAPTDTGANNVYDIVVTASDGAGQSATQNVAITVTAVNDNKPVFTSGTAASVAENTLASATVYTAKATDADLPGQTLSYSLSGVDAAKFSIDATTGVVKFIASPDFEAPTDTGANNVYDIVVTASDGAGQSATQNVAITVTGVNDNSPVFTSGAAVNVAENTATSTAVYTARATDADLPGQVLSYSITGGADAARFSIDATTGVVKFVASPDFEAPSDTGADNVYDLVITANDNAGRTSTQNVAITVTDVGGLVLTNGASANYNVFENNTAIATVQASSENSLTYSLVAGSDSALFSIDATTGALTFKAAPDFEAPADAGANNVYNLTVAVSDGLSTLNQGIAVTVMAVNEAAPVISSNGGGASASITISENSTAVTTVVATDTDLPRQTVVYSITGGADASKFSIDQLSGALRFISAPDFDAPTDAGGNNVYDVRVSATDGLGLSDTQDIAVTVANVNDSVPTISEVQSFQGVYTAGDTLYASVVFTNAVVLTGTATLTLDIGGVLRTASYDSGSGSNTLQFKYIVEPGLNDNNGVGLPSGAITLAPGATLQGSGGVNADLASQGALVLSTVLVDTSAPTQASAFFTEGSHALTFNFDEAVQAVNPGGQVWGFNVHINPDVANNGGWSSVNQFPFSNAVSGLGTNSLTLTLQGDVLGANDIVRAAYDANWGNLTDAVGNALPSQEFFIGGSGNNVIDLDNYGSDKSITLIGNGGNDSLTGTWNGGDTLIDGAGSDVLDGGGRADIIRLVEDGGATLPYAKDIVRVAAGDSSVLAWDKVKGFDTTSADVAQHDVLQLGAAVIASNTNRNVIGRLVGSVQQHSITDGIATFKDATGNAVTINSNNLQDAIDYLSTNFNTAGPSVKPPGIVLGFEVDTDNNGITDSLFVYQDNGSTFFNLSDRAYDTLIEFSGLTGVTLGNSAGNKVLQVQDVGAAEPFQEELNGHTWSLLFPEAMHATGSLAITASVKGTTPVSLNTVAGDGTANLTLTFGGAIGNTDWLLMNYQGTNATNGLSDNAGHVLTGGDGSWVVGGQDGAVIDLSNGAVFQQQGYDVTGGKGDDVMIGTDFDDYFEGRQGADVITGGNGQDHFTFTQGEGVSPSNIDLGADGQLGNGDIFTFTHNVPVKGGGYVTLVGVDRITDFSSGEGFGVDAKALSNLAAPTWMGGSNDTPSSAMLPTNGMATDQGFYLVQGRYNTTTGEFTIDSTSSGTDVMMVYDNDTPRQGAIVLNNVTLAELQASANSNWVSHVVTTPPVTDQSPYGYDAFFTNGSHTATLVFSEPVTTTFGGQPTGVTVHINPDLQNNGGWDGSNALVSASGVGTDTLTLTLSGNTLSASDIVRVTYDNTWGNLVDNSGNQAYSTEFFVGGSGDSVIDLDNYGSSSEVILLGNEGNDTLVGTWTGMDVLIDGTGQDTLDGNGAADIIILVEDGSTSLPYARDTVQVWNDSSDASGWDQIVGLDISSANAANHDALGMVSNKIAGNVVNADGMDAGALARHSINSGIVTFKDTSGTDVSINGLNLQDALDYLAQNITTAGTSVGFEASVDLDNTIDATFVFQDGGTMLNGTDMPDAVVMLTGTTGATLAQTAGANVIQLTDNAVSEPNDIQLSGNTVGFAFGEGVRASTQLALSAKVNGITTANITGVSGNDTEAITITTDHTLTGGEWLLFNYRGNSAANGFSDAAGNVLDVGQSGGFWFARGTDAANTIDLSNAGVFTNANGYEAVGAGGNDTLIGSAFEDFLRGGTGADLLTGGAGHDGFEFDQGDGTTATVNLGLNNVLDSGDTFTFAQGVDRITDLSSGEGMSINAPEWFGQDQVVWMGNGTSTPSTATLPATGEAADQGFFLVEGQFNTGNNTFTVNNTTGTDVLVVYDNQAGIGISQAGLVLSGVTLEEVNAYSGANWFSHV